MEHVKQVDQDEYVEHVKQVDQDEHVKQVEQVDTITPPDQNEHVDTNISETPASVLSDTDDYNRRPYTPKSINSLHSKNIIGSIDESPTASLLLDDYSQTPHVLSPVASVEEDSPQSVITPNRTTRPSPARPSPARPSPARPSPARPTKKSSHSKEQKKQRKVEPERVRFYNNIVGKVKPHAYVRRLNGIRVVLYDFSNLRDDERKQLTVYYRAMLSKILKNTESIRADVFNFKELKTLEEIYGAYAWVKRHTAIIRSLYKYKLIIMGVFVVIEFILKMFIPMDGFVITQIGMLKEYEDLIYDWSEQQGTGYSGRKKKRVRTNPVMSLIKSMTISTGIYMAVGIAIKYFGFNIPQDTVFRTVHGFIDQMKSGSADGSSIISKLANLYMTFTGGSSSSRNTTNTRSAANTPMVNDPLAINPI